MKRKHFIKTASLGSAALLSGPLVRSHFKSPNSSINLGVIGTGSRGAGLIPILNTIPNIKVVGCSDVLDFRLADGLSRTASTAKGYKDYRALLDQKDIDAVLIATPFYNHAQIAIDAIEAGKHVYCEKTMAKGLAGINQLRAAAKGAKTVFQTGHQYHSSRLYTAVVQSIQEGKIGKISAFQSQWNRNGNWRRPVPKPELERQINWRMYREYSGGMAAELSSHQIDFANWVLGELPQQVMGSGGIDYWKDGRETYDNIHLLYSYASGVKATYTCLTSNALDDYKIKVMGDKGTIVLDYTKAWFYPEGDYQKTTQDLDGVSGATKKWDMGSGRPIDIPHQEPSTQALIDFKDHILNGTTPLSTAETGANTALCIHHGITAMTENKIVKMSW